MGANYNAKNTKLSLDGMNGNMSDISILFDNESVALRKELDSFVNYLANRNLFLGFDAGLQNRRGDDNVFLGHNAGSNNNNNKFAVNKRLSSANLFVGNGAGQNNVEGYSNIYIGHNNSKSLINTATGGSSTESIFNNISLGAEGVASGAKTIAIGNSTVIDNANNSTVIGFSSRNTGKNSLVVGSSVTNSGSNSLIIHPYKDNIVNAEDYYFNIAGMFVGTSGGSAGSKIAVKADVFDVEGVLNVDSLTIENLTAGGDVSFCNLTTTGVFTTEGSSQFESTANFQDTVTFRSNVSVTDTIQVGDSLKAVAGEDGYVQVGDLIVDGSTTFAQGVVFSLSQTFEKDVFITGDDTVMSFGTEAKLVLPSADSLYFDDLSLLEVMNNLLAGGNIEPLLPGWVRSRQEFVNLASFTNDLAPWLAADQSEVLLTGFDPTGFLEGRLLSSFSNDLSVFEQEVRFDDTVNMMSNLKIHTNNSANSGEWAIYCIPSVVEQTDFSRIYSETRSDLIFKSNNGAVMCFNDEFEAGLTNFTGQHRCTVEDDVGSFEVGTVVVSTGKYSDLYGKDVVGVDESVPVVRVCSRENDKSVFGVVSAIEKFDDKSMVGLGHIRFEISRSVKLRKIVVNSVGEGAIWVCNSRSTAIENGDLISSSHIPGLGALQEDGIFRNITVAKITCDCDFSMNSEVYKCVEFEFRGVLYRKAFVGCVYHC